MSKNHSVALKGISIIFLFFALYCLVYIIGSNLTIEETSLEENNFRIVFYEKLFPGFFLKLLPGPPGNTSRSAFDVVIIGNNEKQFGPFRVDFKSDLKVSPWGISIMSQDISIGIEELTE